MRRHHLLLLGLILVCANTAQTSAPDEWASRPEPDSTRWLPILTDENLMVAIAREDFRRRGPGVYRRRSLDPRGTRRIRSGETEIRFNIEALEDVEIRYRFDAKGQIVKHWLISTF